MNPFLQLQEKRRWKIVEFGLLVNDQQPNSLVFRMEVDHSGATTFPLARSRPANLSAAPASSNERAGLWICCDESNEGFAFRFARGGRSPERVGLTEGLAGASRLTTARGVSRRIEPRKRRLSIAAYSLRVSHARRPRAGARQLRGITRERNHVGEKTMILGGKRFWWLCRLDRSASATKVRRLCGNRRDLDEKFDSGMPARVGLVQLIAERTRVGRVWLPLPRHRICFHVRKTLAGLLHAFLDAET